MRNIQKSTGGKNSILIVDDSELNRSLLADMLADDFGIIEAENGKEALALLQEREMDIALILLDIVMPELDGFEVLAHMNSRGLIRSIPVIMISAETGSTYIDRAYDLGAVDYISRPFDERTVKHRVMSNYLLALKQHELTDLLYSQVYEHERDNKIMVEILSHIVEFRNGESGLHILHVNTFTELILKHLLKISDKYKLTQSEINTIVNASSLHDIGKMSVPEAILNKPGRLTREEFEVMKLHTVEGDRMLSDITFRHDESIIKVGREICRWHHERYDGSGYPDGLVGDDIPISAQVVALADVYDALTSKRVYKDSYSHEKAIAMIQNGECGVFNPIILKCLDDVKDDLKRELSVTSPTHNIENSIRSHVEQILKSSGSDVSNRTIRLLEHERMKFKFYAGLSRDIFFDYVGSPEAVIFSEFSAESLGVPQKIFDPRSSDIMTQLFEKADLVELIDKMHKTSPENPTIEAKYMLNVNGECKWHKVIAQTLWNDDEQHEFNGAMVKCIDISEETEEIRNLEVLADKDTITGLLNARAAKQKITKRLESADSKDKKYALLFFDLDNLKKANDEHGHLFGNELIKTIADRMLSNTRGTDICARFGGDEFIIFMRYGDDGLEHLVSRIFKCLSQELKGFPVSLSMGISLSGEANGDYETMLRMADQAAYAVKKSTKNNYKFYHDLPQE